MNFDVFISYSHEDKIDAELLCKELDNAGIAYWIDRNIHGSANFVTEIAEKIQQCKVVIFIASSASAKSLFTQKEILFAFKHNKTIVPYRLGNFSFEHNPELDLLFTNIQWLEKVDNVVADVYKLCYNKEYANKKIPTSNSIFTFYKKYYKFFLLCGIMMITLFILFFILKISQNIYQNKLAENEKTRQTIIEEFENAPELPVSERVDIVDLIETFIIDEDEDANVQGWNVFKEYTKKNQLIPRSDGVIWLNDNEHFACKLEFVSKLTYDGDNLDSDIFGQSKTQDITLYGARMGAFLLVIDPTSTPYEVNFDEIINTLKFKRWLSINVVFGWDYIIYRKDYYWLVELINGGCGWMDFKFLISNDYESIIDYVKYIDKNERDAKYLQAAFSENGDKYAIRYGYWGIASVYDKPKLIGNISKIEIEHKEIGMYDKAYYTFNEKGDVICEVDYSENGTIKSTYEYEYDLASNIVRLKENGKYREYNETPYIITDNLPSKNESIYDNNGNIIQTQDYDLNTLTKYKYDKQNNLIKELHIFSHSSKRCHTYTYDDAKNIIEERIEETDKQTVIINYKYDDIGNVISLTRTPGRYSTSPSTTTYKITYR